MDGYGLATNRWKSILNTEHPEHEWCCGCYNYSEIDFCSIPPPSTYWETCNSRSTPYKQRRQPFPILLNNLICDSKPYAIKITRS